MKKLDAVQLVPGMLWSVDISEAEYLPKDWDRKIVEVCQHHARDAILFGNSTTSLEEDFVRLPYRLLDGIAVSKLIPWLTNLYRDPFRKLASRLTGREIYCSQSLINSINVNILDKVGSRYERHLDSNSLTGLLFVTTAAARDGGELVFEFPEQAIAIKPRLGNLLFFTATGVPHKVEPLRSNSARVSVPMNYYFDGDKQDRPIGLDTALYNHPTGTEQEQRWLRALFTS